METDLNYFLSNNDTVNSILFNFTNQTPVSSGYIDFPKSGVPVTGMDIVITFMIIQTICMFVILWYQMRGYKHWSGGGGNG